MDAEPLTREACGGSDSDTPLVGDVCNALADCCIWGCALYCLLCLSDTNVVFENVRLS